MLGFSNVLPPPHQAPPPVTATQVAHIPAGALVRLTLALVTVTLPVLTALDLM